MFWYRGHWGLIRWIPCAFFYLLSIVLLGVFIRMSIVKKITVPDALKNYIASFPPERYYEALQMELSAAGLLKREHGSDREDDQENAPCRKESNHSFRHVFLMR